MNLETKKFTSGCNQFFVKNIEILFSIHTLLISILLTLKSRCRKDSVYEILNYIWSVTVKWTDSIINITYLWEQIIKGRWKYWLEILNQMFKAEHWEQNYNAKNAKKLG